MSTTRFRRLWTIGIEHEFHGGAADVLEFVVPGGTAAALAGARALARASGGRLHVLVECEEAGAPLVAIAGRRFVFGLRPRAASFALVTAPPDVPPGMVPLWHNRADAGRLGAPLGVRPGDPPLHVEPALLDAWGLLELTVDVAHLGAGRAFALTLAARRDTLRYYVVAARQAAAEFEQVQVVDAGAAAEGRAAIEFARTLPAAFGPGHLSPALLDPSGAARVALFEARSPVARRARGPAGIELRRNGDVLIGHLPQPGAERADAQFVVHLTPS